jgi:NitT/TauT family transport system substrate-binding protein
MKKNRLLSIFVSMALVIVAGCGSQGTPTSSSNATSNPSSAAAPEVKKEDSKDLEHIVWTQSTHGFLYSPVYIAKDKGFFEQEGLDVEVVITGGGSKVMAAVIGGSAQVGATALSSAMDATKKGQAVLSFGALMNQYASNLVIKADIAKQKGISESSSLDDKIKALKGLKIGITSPGSGSDKLVRVLLKKVGIDPDQDVQLVPIGENSAMVTAFKQNKIDAFALSSPTSEVAVAGGKGMYLINLSKGEVPELNGITYISLVAKKDSLEKNPELYKKIYRAVSKAEEFIEKDKAGAKEVLKKNLSDTDAAIFDQAFDNNYDAIAKSPKISKEAFEKNYMFSEAKDIPYDQAVTNME